MSRGGKRTGAGRPAGAENRATAETKRALSDLAAGHADAAIGALVHIAQHGQSESARVSAAVAILDRGFGRPRQAVEVENITPPEPMQITWRVVEPLNLAWGNASTSALHELHQLLTDAEHPQAGAVASEIGRREAH